MTAHPDPAASFHLLVVRVSCAWWRIHARNRDPLHFGRDARNRFDAPAGEFGVLYVARDPHAAFIETFGHATGVRFVTSRDLAARGLARVTARRPLRLVDLRGEGLARMGADAELTGGRDYELSRRWARAMHAHPRLPDGILYRARHDPARTSAAIFDRAQDTLTAEDAGTLAARRHRKLLGSILDTYRFGWIP